MSIQETTTNALALWSEKHAESTVHCQGVYFSVFLRTAEENGFHEPCQELYDLFLKDATTPATRYCRTQIIKAVDFVADTHGTTPNGTFFNEPPFPTENEAYKLLSSLDYPISSPIDISFIIVRGAAIVEQLGTSPDGRKQYWHSWRDIRTYFFLQNSSMNYDTETLVQYLKELDERYHAGLIPQSNYYMHRKAAFILREIAETGSFQWKRVQTKPIQGEDDPELEGIRLKYLSYLKENNYAEKTIRLRDYVFRNAIKFAEIHTALDLFHLSVEDVGNILKGFAECYRDVSPITPVIRMMFRYFYEQGFLKEDRAEMVMAPFRHHGTLPCYIPSEEDANFILLLIRRQNGTRQLFCLPGNWALELGISAI